MSKDVKELKTENAYPLQKHTPKSFGVAFVLGVVIGLAIIVPGVSGSTVAIMFGMYAALLYAIGNIFNDFKRCLAYLLPIGIGAVIGFLGGFLVIQKVFGRYMFMVVCLFAGLMCGAIPALTAEIRGEKRSAGRILLAAVGVLIPLAVGAASILLDSGEAASATASFTEFPAHLFILYIPLGAVVSATQIIPGLSATAILMACGQFAPILNSLHLDYILENPAVLGLYVCIGGGFLGGIVLISRIFSKIIEKHRAPTFFLVVGLSLGSILSMFLNTDMWEVYTSWSEGADPTLSVAVGVPLLAVGFICSFLLTRYELKKR
ncbi:MAG: DUF368 domain-containing protein [Clostridia bacterium]|nr:DUF368 domain-containing protein [Clostridia bacterium]